MNIRAHKPAEGTPRRPPEAVGSGAVAEAEHDRDMAQLVSAEAEAPTVDHQIKVALAAYFIAEQRGFEPGHELDDWLAAEAQIAAAEQPGLIASPQVFRAESLS